ncbi:MAG TPA: hypothetical protein VFE37_14260 [Chloroflexota bacterium]|nr:hypothetical protein [Chloroflexota bacterium]
MALRLGPITLPWPGKPTDDPYWDYFLHTPPHDIQNSAVDLVQRAPEGAVNPAQEEIHSPEINARHIKELATFLGANLVGIAALDPAAPDTPEGYPFAVVSVVRAEHDPCQAPGIGGQVPVQNGLYVTFVLSAYIRELGFRATAKLPADKVRLAAAAGLGTVDAQGRLVTPQHGARVYVADVVFTDLPLAPDR